MKKKQSFMIKEKQKIISDYVFNVSTNLAFITFNSLTVPFLSNIILLKSKIKYN